MEFFSIACEKKKKLRNVLNLRCYGLYFRELSALEAHKVVLQSDTTYFPSSDWSILGFLLKRHQYALTCLENIGQVNIKGGKNGFPIVT